MTILVVDDEANFREIAEMKLKAAGFEVAMAENGADAVKKAAEAKPDLVLMDINMPGVLSGVDAAFKIKESPETATVKIAFLSSAADPWPMMTGERRDVSQAFGMEDFISKADGPDIMLVKVQGMLGLVPRPPSNMIQ